jgi:hypothetical protein
MLLSRNKPVIASSSEANHPPINAVNEDVRKWWSATSGRAGEFLQINLTRHSTINAVQINFADEGSTQTGRAPGVYYQYTVQVSDDGVAWKTVIDKSTNTADLPHEYVQLDPPVEGTLVRIVNVRVPEPILFSLYGLRIFGKQNRTPPSAPTNLIASRHTDTRSVTLTWTASPNSVGYNIRFGSHPKKLYHNYIAYDRTSLDINALLAHQDYWFTIDAFNEGGITQGTVIVGPKGPAPVITRVSSPSWGTFPSTGPSSDQVIQYSLVDSVANQTWRVSWRFDAEAFRATNAEAVPGTNSYTFPKSAFTGSRVTTGSHSASIQVTGSKSGASNVVSVSYTIATAAGIRSMKAMSLCGAACVGVSALTAFRALRKKKNDPNGNEGALA